MLRKDKDEEREGLLMGRVGCRRKECSQIKIELVLLIDQLLCLKRKMKRRMKRNGKCIGCCCYCCLREKEGYVEVDVIL